MSSWYDIENKSNRFMQFVSREMMRRNKSKSYADEPTSNKNPIPDSWSREPSVNKNNLVGQIYSQSQFGRYKRGSMLRSNSNNNSTSTSTKKKDMTQSYLNFYEGLKAKQRKNKTKHQATSNSLFVGQEECSAEQLHYQMVQIHQNAKKLQCRV